MVCLTYVEDSNLVEVDHLDSFHTDMGLHKSNYEPTPFYTVGGDFAKGWARRAADLVSFIFHGYDVQFDFRHYQVCLMTCNHASFIL